MTGHGIYSGAKITESRFREVMIASKCSFNFIWKLAFLFTVSLNSFQPLLINDPAKEKKQEEGGGLLKQLLPFNDHKNHNDQPPLHEDLRARTLHDHRRHTRNPHAASHAPIRATIHDPNRSLCACG